MLLIKGSLALATNKSPSVLNLLTMCPYVPESIQQSLLSTSLTSLRDTSSSTFSSSDKDSYTNPNFAQPGSN